jgi:hypothetical protein
MSVNTHKQVTWGRGVLFVFIMDPPFAAEAAATIPGVQQK